MASRVVFDDEGSVLVAPVEGRGSRTKSKSSKAEEMGETAGYPSSFTHSPSADQMTKAKQKEKDNALAKKEAKAAKKAMKAASKITNAPDTPSGAATPNPMVSNVPRE